MKTIMLYACVLILSTSCQKEISFPETVKEGPHEVKIPDLLPEPEPTPEEPPADTIPDAEPEPSRKDPLDPPPGEISESVYLRNLQFFLNSDNHFKLAKVYTDRMNLWIATPEWAKDDIHTFSRRGAGLIESPGKPFPENPFNNINQKWDAYFENNAIKLYWVDARYKPVVYTLVYAVPGEYFKAFRIVNGEKTYFIFQNVK